VEGRLGKGEDLSEVAIRADERPSGDLMGRDQADPYRLELFFDVAVPLAHVFPEGHRDAVLIDQLLKVRDHLVSAFDSAEEDPLLAGELSEMDSSTSK